MFFFPNICVTDEFKFFNPPKVSGTGKAPKSLVNLLTKKIETASLLAIMYVRLGLAIKTCPKYASQKSVWLAYIIYPFFFTTRKFFLPFIFNPLKTFPSTNKIGRAIK